MRKVTQAINHQREQIASLREASARNARPAAITTLAAGAAHELGSPLGTIAIAAHDARLALDAVPGAGAVAEDLRLIALEVDRCQEIPSLARLEWEHIERVLRECNGNISKTARVLGMHRRPLQHKLAKFPVPR